ncbi:MAG: adenylate/guanylate cyclase domain-containing protein [Chloroflexi bacterium]|nr:adenylate/guanylate cyclase domain-containing protein [Chloroflexota bacterium]
MPNKVTVIMFTDLKGSTELTEGLGHDAYVPELMNHFDVITGMADLVGGTGIKNTGDGYLIEFEDPTNALRLSSNLQEFYLKQPCLSRQALEIKIGIELGVVFATADDVFGSGVNRGVRMRDAAKPGEVLIGNNLYQAVSAIWGPTQTQKYLASVGKCALKGVANEQELYSFDWRTYAHENPDVGLAKWVTLHLELGGIEVYNLAFTNLASPSVVVWPVVPRNVVTVIHRGQTELIRLLALLGWRVTLLIADCGAGANRNYSRTDCERFQQKLLRYVQSRGVNPHETLCLSELFAPSFKDYPKVQAGFRTIASRLKLEQMLAINNKDYEDKVKEDIKTNPTLDFLRPALSIAAVHYLAELAEQKVVVVAGKDERIQWEQAVHLAQERLGVLMNPVLRDEGTHQSHQGPDWPIWSSKQSLEEAMRPPSNLAWWLFLLLGFVPSFPGRVAMVGTNRFPLTSCPTEPEIPEGLDLNALAENLWDRLDPAR